MVRFFQDANYDVLRGRKPALIASLVFTVPGLILLAIRGLNEGIDFTGGVLLQIEAHAASITTASMRAALDAAGLTSTEITTAGAPDEFFVRTTLATEPGPRGEAQPTQDTRAAVNEALRGAFGEGNFEIVLAETVGPKVSSELRRLAVLAILMGFGAIFIYLSIRMEWRFGVAAVLATVHDIFATMALVSYLNLEVSVVMVAALLTIVGYSLNDTIVTFDRVRENLRKFRRENLYGILNRSINETLPRTVLTSGTTIAASSALVVFGPPTLRGFALVITAGIVIGTYSSIFIASPLLLVVERRWPGQSVRGARTVPTGGATVVDTPKPTAKVP